MLSSESVKIDTAKQNWSLKTLNSYFSQESLKTQQLKNPLKRTQCALTLSFPNPSFLPCKNYLPWQSNLKIEIGAFDSMIDF